MAVKIAGKEALQTLWTRVYEEYPRGIKKSSEAGPALRLTLRKGYDNNGTWVETGALGYVDIVKQDIVDLGIPAAWPTVPSAATENPKMDAASASVGTHSKYAREDHVHPTDTSRAEIASPAFTGTPTITSAPAAGDNSSKIPTTAWVQTELLSTMGDVAGALVYKGTVDAAADLLNIALKKGWYYVAEGDFTLNGEQITPGDMIIVKTAGTYTTEANLDTATDIVGSNTTLLKQSDMTGWFTIPPATPSA